MRESVPKGSLWDNLLSICEILKSVPKGFLRNNLRAISAITFL
jgi:hypothetical protein